MNNISHLNIDKFIKFERLLTASRLKQTSPTSPSYENIKILKEQYKNKIKTLLSTMKSKKFYDYMIQQKKRSKTIKQNMPEFDFIIDFGKITIRDTNDLKIFYIVSHKQAVSAMFDVNKKQIDLMILNNNNIIKNLEERQLDPTLTTKQYNDNEDLIYSIKIKNELYKHIYSHL